MTTPRRKRCAIAATLTTVLATGLLWVLAEDPTFAATHQQDATSHWVATNDGAHVWLQHYAADGPPVVLVHGISSNHHFWDLREDRSLALWLQAQGYDVWNMDLRGHGPARFHPNGKRQKAGWTVDDYGTQDLPAAFAYVLEQSGAEQLHYVGHSMGGMVLAIYLADHPDPPLASAVIAASPLDFRDPDLVMQVGMSNAWMARIFSFVPTPMGANLIAPMKHAPLHIDERLFNPALISSDARTEMYHRIVSPMSRGELGQFARARHGEFTSADGSRVYRTSLQHVHVPMLFLAGRDDHIAPPDTVFSYYQAVGSPQKEFVILSTANGYSGDYGHLDLGLADEASAEVYPLIGDWFRSNP